MVPNIDLFLKWHLSLLESMTGREFPQSSTQKPGSSLQWWPSPWVQECILRQNCWCWTLPSSWWWSFRTYPRVLQHHLRWFGLQNWNHLLCFKTSSGPELPWCCSGCWASTFAPWREFRWVRSPQMAWCPKYCLQSLNYPISLKLLLWPLGAIFRVWENREMHIEASAPWISSRLGTCNCSSCRWSCTPWHALPPFLLRLSSKIVQDSSQSAIALFGWFNPP